MKLLRFLPVLVLAICSQAEAQSANFAFKRTLNDGSNYTYCSLVGQNNDPYAGPIQGVGALTTSGSSTTVNASSTTAFSTVPTPSDTVGAVLIISVDGGSSYSMYRVASKTDNDTVVLDTAVNYASPGYQWGWFREVCGTTALVGWLSVGKLGIDLTVEYNTGSGTANVVWECLAGTGGASPVQVYPDNSAAAASRAYTAPSSNARTTVVIDARFAFCRIGMKGSGPVITAYAAKR